jgi:hypothetical protein
MQQSPRPKISDDLPGRPTPPLQRQLAGFWKGSPRHRCGTGRGEPSGSCDNGPGYDEGGCSGFSRPQPVTCGVRGWAGRQTSSSLSAARNGSVDVWNEVIEASFPWIKYVFTFYPLGKPGKRQGFHKAAIEEPGPLQPQEPDPSRAVAGGARPTVKATWED